MTTQGPRCKRPEFYRDKIVLAPMVRANNLPFRILCLEYGADLVYTEELIDYRLSRCRRLENKVLKTIDYIDEHGELLLRLDPKEKERLILQIGSNNPDRAVKAAQLVAQDISGVDFNFGCPKGFSISGGMGAALLEKPDEIRALLTKSSQNLDLPITCKIRLLPELDKTLELVEMIESCGVSAIAVHGRTKTQRQGHDNQNEVLVEISKVLQTIPMIANGGSNEIRTHSDILKFKERTRASSVMIARKAMQNPSIFRPDNVLEPIETIISQYLKLAVRYDNFIPLTKYTLQSLLGAGHFEPHIYQRFHAAPDYQSLCDLFGLGEWYAENKITANKRDYYEEKLLVNDKLEEYIKQKRESFEATGLVKEFVLDSVPFNPKICDIKSPKGLLNDHVNKLTAKKQISHAQFDVIRLGKNHYNCSVVFDSTFYLNKSHTNSKKSAEHATSMLILDRLNLMDLSSYRTRISACTRNIA